MQVTASMKKELRSWSDMHLKYTHAIVYTDPAGEVPFKYEGYEGYCNAQDATADFAMMDVDFIVVNLVTL
jgi:hypothetical protein